MQLKDIEFQASPVIEAVRKVARQLDFKTLRLADMECLQDELTDAQRPNYTGMTFAQFFRHQGPQGPHQLVVKPGQFITDYFPKTTDPLTMENIYVGLRDIRWLHPSDAKKVSDAVLTSYALEQYARERLSYLLADAIGMGAVYAPILPVEGRHKNFLLAGSLVMGSGDVPKDLIIDGAYDQRWWESDEDALKTFSPLLRDHPKLWSLICANLPFRAFIGDADHNPGAYVLTMDRMGQYSPYAVDSGSAFNYINQNRPLCDSLKQSRAILKYTRFDFVKQGAPTRIDTEIVEEVAGNIYRLPSRKLYEIVRSVAKSMPFFVLGGKEQSVDKVFQKLEESRRRLAGNFAEWIYQVNAACKLRLFTSRFPKMVTAKSYVPDCQRPDGHPEAPFSFPSAKC